MDSLFILNIVIPIVTLGGVIISIVLFITNNDNKSKNDITGIKKDVAHISGELTEIKTNHLPHIDSKMERIGDHLIGIDTKLNSHLVEHAVKKELKKNH